MRLGVKWKTLEKKLIPVENQGFVIISIAGSVLVLLPSLLHLHFLSSSPTTSSISFFCVKLTFVRIRLLNLPPKVCKVFSIHPMKEGVPGVLYTLTQFKKNGYSGTIISVLIYFDEALVREGYKKSFAKI